MKRWIVAVTMIGLTASLTTSLAQQADPDRTAEIEAKAQEKLEQVIEELNLTDDQRAEMRPILEASFERQAAVLEEYDIEFGDQSREDRLSRRERRALRNDLENEREKTLEALADVLDEDQLKAYQEMADERKEEVRSRLQDRRNN